MRTEAVIFDRVYPELFDCGAFAIQIKHLGVVPGDEPFIAKAHSHDFFELHYIDRGEGISHSDGQEFEDLFYSGTFYFAKPGENHEHHSVCNNPLKIYFIGFDIQKTDGKESFANELYSRLLRVTSIQYQAFFLKPILMKLFEEAMMCSYGQEHILKGILMQLIITIARAVPDMESVNSSGVSIENRMAVQDSLQYLYSNLFRRIKLEELAKYSKLSQSHYRRLFKEITGKTVGEFIRDYRTRRAQELLLAGCPVKEVAYQLGYETPEHFSKVFKKETGVNPNQWKFK